MAGKYSIDEMGRLIGAGLPPLTAMRVIDGSLDEAEAIRKVIEARNVEQWMASNAELPDGLEADWDLAREHFHFALDGADASDPRFDAIAVVEADPAEVLPKLTYASTRSDGPWTERFRCKTAKTAYRWSVGLPVTPPLVVIHAGQLHIEGGMHRFHLAHHLGTKRIPLLVDQSDVSAVLRMLPSATALP